MTRPIITLTTDFGLDDPYVAQMKGVILAINPDVQLVDVTHAIAKQDVLHAARMIDETVDAFKRNTIHVVVIDPGVGTDRLLIGVELGRWRFVAPDNGVLSAVAQRFPLSRSVRLTRETFWRGSISNTFHGRDVMAPVAAHWSLDADLSAFGEPLRTPLLELPLPQPERLPDGVRGEVLRADSFGNLVTNVDCSWLPAGGWSGLTVRLGSQTINGICRCYDEESPGTLMALIGSNGKLEIAVSRGSAQELLKPAPDATVTVLGFIAPTKE
jgi:hypothetical protein